MPVQNVIINFTEKLVGFGTAMKGVFSRVSNKMVSSCRPEEKLIFRATVYLIFTVISGDRIGSRFT